MPGLDLDLTTHLALAAGLVGAVLVVAVGLLAVLVVVVDRYWRR